MSGFNGGAVAPIQVVNNLTTTGAGYALDARQGKILDNNKMSKSVDNENVTAWISYNDQTKGMRWVTRNGHTFCLRALSSGNKLEITSKASGSDTVTAPISIDSNNSVLINNHPRIFTKVTDIGLTSGSATISAAYSALPLNTILIAEYDQFASSEYPSSPGMIEINKFASIARGFITFHGKTSAIGDYRMFLNSDNSVSGTWEKIATKYKKHFNSVTTNVDGMVDSGLYTTNNECALSVAVAVNSQYLASIVGVYQSQWIIRFFNYSDNSIAKNKTITDIDVYYIK